MIKFFGVIICIIIIILILNHIYMLEHMYLSTRLLLIPSKKRVKILQDMLIDIYKYSQNCHPWLMFGTLLGYVREKNIIECDYDNDIGISRYEYENMKINMKKLVAENPQYNLVDLDSIISHGMILTHTETGLATDIDCFIIKDNYIHLDFIVDFFTSKHPCRANIFPLSPVNFLGTTMYIPNNYNKVLEDEYGTDFMTPIHDFIEHEDVNYWMPKKGKYLTFNKILESIR
jgi:phosphorylcholine metabolism protein LicD